MMTSPAPSRSKPIFYTPARGIARTRDAVRACGPAVAAAVNDKTFTDPSLRSDGGLALSVKLPVSGKEALKLPNASMMERYRAQAPRRLMKELETRQPWVKAGGLPE
jgi:hypothetical protein